MVSWLALVKSSALRSQDSHSDPGNWLRRTKTLQIKLYMEKLLSIVAHETANSLWQHLLGTFAFLVIF